MAKVEVRVMGLRREAFDAALKAIKWRRYQDAQRSYDAAVAAGCQDLARLAALRVGVERAFLAHEIHPAKEINVVGG